MNYSELINLISIFFPINKAKCTHDKIQPSQEGGYCPDCGKYIQNEWYITRCSCCGVKMKSMVKNGQIVPQHHYCTNCGSDEFNVEKIEQINFIDINFAALIKKEADTEFHPTTTRLWQERINEQPKLLAQYL
jgi:hypothetical protein